MPTPRVVDLSHHNIIPASLHPAREAGIWGVIHKATDGTSFVDPKLDARFHLTKDAGLLWGAYHFLRPGNSRAQAEHFIETMVPFTDDKTLFACDFEKPKISLRQVDEFMDAVEARTGRSCVLYTGHQLKDAIRAGETVPADLPERRLWLAQYSAKTAVPKGWSSWWLWQYSDAGAVPGIMPPTDVNAYEGTVDQLEDEWSGKPVEVEPPQPPHDRPVISLACVDDIEIRLNGKVIYP